MEVNLAEKEEGKHVIYAGKWNYEVEESNFSRRTLGFAGIYGSTVLPHSPFPLVKLNQLAFFPPRNPLVLDYA